MIPMGMSRPGFLHSSAHVETASKPMYAKKMIAAPAPMPANAVRREGVPVLRRHVNFVPDEDEEREHERS